MRIDRVPELRYAVIRGDRVIIVGLPGIYSWLHEDDLKQHNCDAMGCSSLEHVIAEVPLRSAPSGGTDHAD